MRKNVAKEKLKKGEVVIGTFVTFRSATMVEICGHAGFDFVIIDAEHGPLTPESCEDLVRAADVTGMTPIVRVTRNHPAEILRYLDIGALGVQIPMVRTADDARRAVEAVKYHPLGQRGLGGARASAWGMKGGFGQYLADANRETMVIIQIETKEAVENISAILAVEGVDAILIGRLDLSQAYGIPGQSHDPLISETVERLINEAQAAGVAVGLFELDPQRAVQYKSRGVRLFETWLGYFLARAAAGYMQQVRGDATGSVPGGEV
ncbi:MAG: HpcH/HpaI aldolase/citrate lyase family protein [Anaerolineae bacterium]